MKKIVVYYSLEGNTRLMAESIAEVIDADLLEIKPIKDIPSKGFKKYFLGGRAALKKETPELLPVDKNVQDYDLIFIGTPVWAGTFAPALNTFLQENLLEQKKIALFCCHGGGKGKVFGKMQEALGENEFIGEIDFKDPLKGKKEESVKEIQSWAKTLVN